LEQLKDVNGDDVAMLDNLILQRRVRCSMSALSALLDNIDVCRERDVFCVSVGHCWLAQP